MTGRDRNTDSRGIATCISLDMERAYRIRACTFIEFGAPVRDEIRWGYAVGELVKIPPAQPKLGYSEPAVGVASVLTLTSTSDRLIS